MSSVLNTLILVGVLIGGAWAVINRCTVFKLCDNGFGGGGSSGGDQENLTGTSKSNQGDTSGNNRDNPNSADYIPPPDVVTNRYGTKSKSCCTCYWESNIVKCKAHGNTYSYKSGKTDIDKSVDLCVSNQCSDSENKASAKKTADRLNNQNSATTVAKGIKDQGLNVNTNSKGYDCTSAFCKQYPSQCGCSKSKYATATAMYTTPDGRYFLAPANSRYTDEVFVYRNNPRPFLIRNNRLVI